MSESDPKRLGDESLMAYADGALDAADARVIEAAAARDPALAARIELYRRTAAMARDALSPELQVPVPAALRAAVERTIAAANSATDQPAAAAARGVAGRGWRRVAANLPVYGLAAGLAAAFGVGGFLVGSLSGGPAAGTPDWALALAPAQYSALQEALERLPSGSTSTLRGGETAQLHLVATFQRGDGELCREFELQRQESGMLAVACRSDRRWDIALVLRTAGGDDAFAPASAAGVLDQWLAAADAGPPLEEAEEAAALAGADSRK